MDSTDTTKPAATQDTTTYATRGAPNPEAFFDFLKQFVHYETQFDKQPVANQQEYFAVWLGQQIPGATNFYYSTQNLTDAFFAKTTSGEGGVISFLSQPELVAKNQLVHVEVDITQDGHMHYARVTETFADNTLDPQTITSRAFSYLNKDGNYHIIDCLDPMENFNDETPVIPVIPWAICASDDKIAPDEIFLVMRTEAF